MITLTRLSGSVFLLNADLIERVDSTPDTIITLVDGKKYVVAETMTQVLDAVVAFRGEVVALGSLLDAVHPYLNRKVTDVPESGQPKLATVSEFATPHPRRTGNED
ncbi:flagellar FlbD family protein [Nocardioides sp. Iso805N]|uniref:flagellar FlbD family protein n=1 Tax=Nocardioides sp. Iso805N TaxID=1283287 RepID=UPI0003829F2B|nr:flagellar FlbD family protein [Nocardioides sp. Iso805N]